MGFLRSINSAVALTIAGVSLLSCLVLGGLVWWQSYTLDDLRDDKVRLERSEKALIDQVEQARLSAEVSKAHAARARAISARTEAAIRQIQSLELGGCADAPIDSRLLPLLGGGQLSPSN